MNHFFSKKGTKKNEGGFDLSPVFLAGDWSASGTARDFISGIFSEKSWI